MHKFGRNAAVYLFIFMFLLVVVNILGVGNQATQSGNEVSYSTF